MKACKECDAPEICEGQTGNCMIELTKKRFPASSCSPFGPYQSEDWAEDSDHENGNYRNECCYCKRQFTGHKRRVVCKICSKENESGLPSAGGEPSKTQKGN
tara:strand:+ start:2568 stop:2873 length:306 start_codon:yes stop_codon:yes gene_type:complete